MGNPQIEIRLPEERIGSRVNVTRGGGDPKRQERHEPDYENEGMNVW